MEEKRRFVRLERELPLTFERRGPTGTLRGKGITKNISPTGLCLLAKSPLGVGEKITITLTLPKHPQPVSLEARVKWVRPRDKSSYESGVEISSVTETNQNHYLLFTCDLLCDQLAQQKLL